MRIEPREFGPRVAQSTRRAELDRLIEPNSRDRYHVHFGLDLAWDTFICLGTLLFGLAMLRRPGFGPVVGGAGIVIAIAVYAVNFATFPEPPSESAVDLGPLIGLWYAAVSVLLLRRQVLAPDSGERSAMDKAWTS